MLTSPAQTAQIFGWRVGNDRITVATVVGNARQRKPGDLWPRWDQGLWRTLELAGADDAGRVRIFSTV